MVGKVTETGQVDVQWQILRYLRVVQVLTLKQSVKHIEDGSLHVNCGA